MRTSQNYRHIIKKGIGIILLAFPVILLLGFALHFSSFEDFFQFKMKYVQNDAVDFFSTLTGARRGQFVMAHAIAYSSVPFWILTILCMGYRLFPERPFLAVVGVVTGITGTVFLSGVFAAWLSFAAIGNVSPEYNDGAIASLEALTEMQGTLKVITMLSVLSLIGLMVLSVGFLFTNKLPKWSPVSILVGSALIVVFMDLDNWMFLGALLMLIGLLPLSLQLIKEK